MEFEISPKVDLEMAETSPKVDLKVVFLDESDVKTNDHLKTLLQCPSLVWEVLKPAYLLSIPNLEVPKMGEVSMNCSADCSGGLLETKVRVIAMEAPGSQFPFAGVTGVVSGQANASLIFTHEAGSNAPVGDAAVEISATTQDTVLAPPQQLPAPLSHFVTSPSETTFRPCKLHSSAIQFKLRRALCKCSHPRRCTLPFIPAVWPMIWRVGQNQSL